MASKNMKKFYVVWVGKKPVPLFALVAFLGKLTRLLRRVGLASLPTLTHHLPAKATRFVPYPLQKTKMFITKGLADSKLLGHASFTTTMIYLHCRRSWRGLRETTHPQSRHDTTAVGATGAAATTCSVATSCSSQAIHSRFELPPPSGYLLNSF